MNVSARNITGLVDALERTGYVRRGPHPSDRRATIVTPTERGARTMREMASDHEQLSAELMASVESADAEGFLRGLDAIASRLRVMVAAAAPGGEGER